jgi:hypothetical protein
VPAEPAPPEWDEPLEVEWVEAEVVDPGPVPADPIPGDPFVTDLFPSDPVGGEVATTTTVRPGDLPLPIPLAPPIPRDAIAPAPLAPSPPYQPVPRERGWTLPAPAPAPTWGQPTARPARRRRSWIVALVLLVVAALLAAGLVWLAPSLRTARVLNPASGGASSSASRSLGASSARADPATAVKPVLAARARAVLRHDRAAFLATIDQRRTTFYRAQAALFDRMVTVPFSDLAYRVAAPGRDLSNARVRRTYAPSQVYLSEVEASYRFRRQDSAPTTSRYYYTFTLTPAGWRLGGQGDLPAPRTGDVEIWDATPVRSLATTRTLVVYHPSDRALAQRLLNAAEQGFSQVDASWPEWDHKVVILVPRDQAEAERLLHGRDLSDTAAVSASHVEAGALRRVLGNRVIVNTTFMKGYSTLAVQLVIAHEMTHVATRTVGLGVPLFLVEGFADYTAFRPVDLPLRVTRQALAITVRDGGFDGRLPTDAEIVGPNGALAYDKASTFCLWVSRTYGQAKLRSLYASFSIYQERATTLEADEQMRRTLGISLATAQSRWAAFVRQVM